MNFLADTNVLLRLIQLQSPHHAEVENAVDRLLKNGDTLFLTLQNISEFWNVCTRPRDKNGLGFSVAQADAELTKIEQIFDLLPDTLMMFINIGETGHKSFGLGRASP